MAATGQNIDIYTSTDSGVTWTDQSGSGALNWRSITSSSDGTKLAAAAQSGDIYTSTDNGVTWTDRSGAGTRSWFAITSSSDGTKLAAAVNGGDIYTSTDSGATWTDQTGAGSRSWLAITSSSDGTKLAAAASGGDIYTSIDSGATWTDQTAAGSHGWESITSSSDGAALAATISVGHIWTGTTRGTVTLAHSNIVNGNGLVGYWTFDGPNTHWNTGTTDDVSGNGNTGQLIGMSTSTSPVAGKIGQALRVSSVSYVGIPATGSLEPQNLTVSAWVKTQGTSAAQIIFNSGLGYAVIFDGHHGWIEAGINNFDCDNTSGSNTFSPNIWQHVVFTYDGSTDRFYRNGALLRSAACGEALDYTGVTTLFFNNESFQEAGPSTIDDVRIYNRALGAQEIQQLYNAGR